MLGSNGMTLLDDDRLQPSQECTVQLKKDANGSISIQDDYKYVKLGEGKLAEIKEDGSLGEVMTKVELSIADCLACSGCITSAETLLVSKQNLELFLSKAEDAKKRQMDPEADNLHIFVILPPQVVIAIGRRYKVSRLVAYKALRQYLFRMGVEFVLDPAVARDFVIREVYEDFLAKLRDKDRQLPMLISTCPGWVCYAEKLHDTILPCMSTVKSPQQVMARLIRDVLCVDAFGESFSRPEVQRDRVVVASIMPCYDKKLEASREDFVLTKFEDGSPLREVDVVITSKEIVENIEENDMEVWTKLLKEASNTSENVAIEGFTGEFESRILANGEYLTPEGEGSGGYIEEIYKKLATEYGEEIPKQIDFKRVTNNDFSKAILDTGGELGEVRLGKTYGFRNLQNILRRAKANRLDFDIIDVQACPKACLNGGGQPPLSSRIGETEKPRPFLDSMIAIAKERPHVGFWHDVSEKYWNRWFGGDDGEFKRKDVLHTEYHSRKDLETVGNAGVSISW